MRTWVVEAVLRLSPSLTRQLRAGISCPGPVYMNNYTSLVYLAPTGSLRACLCVIQRPTGIQGIESGVARRSRSASARICLLALLCCSTKSRRTLVTLRPAGTDAFDLSSYAVYPWLSLSLSLLFSKHWFHALRKTRPCCRSPPLAPSRSYKFSLPNSSFFIAITDYNFLDAGNLLWSGIFIGLYCDFDIFSSLVKNFHRDEARLRRRLKNAPSPRGYVWDHRIWACCT